MATAPFAVTDRSYQTLHSVGAVCNRKAMLSHILVGPVGAREASQIPIKDFAGAVGHREPMHNRILVG
ncbi:MAG: hypothetical protein K9J03_03695, partial [Candidatus Methylopumilus sp.]|nr:hypothetical protein [Candidatus Methylopumilus sp.]